MSSILILPLTLVSAAAILLLFIGIRSFLVGRGESVTSRLDLFSAQSAAVAIDAPKVRTRSTTKWTTGLDRAVARQGFAQKLAKDLSRADIKVTVGEFLVLTLVLGALGFLIGLALHNIFIGIALLLAGIFCPRFYVNFAKARRLKAFNGQLADAIQLLANSLRSGYSMLQSMELISREGRPPISKEFERVIREIGLGLAPEEALANLVKRIESDDLDLMVTSVNIQREVGGNLAEMLDTIAKTIRERVKIKNEIKTLTAQQQYAGYIITLLPVGLGGILYLISPSYMSRMFTETHWCGWCMMIAAGLMIVAGFFVMRKIVKIEV